MIMRKLLASTILSTTLATLPVFAEQNIPSYCHRYYQNDYLTNVDGSENQQELVDVKSRQAQLVADGTSIFSDDVVITHEGWELSSDKASYNPTSGLVTTYGDMQLRDSEIIIKSEQAEWNTELEQGALIGANYRLRQNHARGTADYMFRQGSESTKVF